MLCGINLDVMHTRERQISLFLSGDYEFLCKVYGLSGASGEMCKKNWCSNCVPY